MNITIVSVVSRNELRLIDYLSNIPNRAITIVVLNESVRDWVMGEAFIAGRTCTPSMFEIVPARTDLIQTKYKRQFYLKDYPYKVLRCKDDRITFILRNQ